MNRIDTNTRSVLALLRGLVPKRQLNYHEALRIAELQANRLLEHFAIETAAVHDEIVTELPRIRIERAHGLPVSGAAHWNGRYWVISLNADDHPLRQRFSLMHEFKHILDHATAGHLDDHWPSGAHGQAERVADYFAACLLMPKRVVKRLWCEGPQSIECLADRLRVSPAALRYRLDQLGLTERPARCETARHRHASRTVTRDRPLRPALAGGDR
jgi:Zn-dependent peptidase ImmA (M78 family)